MSQSTPSSGDPQAESASFWSGVRAGEVAPGVHVEPEGQEVLLRLHDAGWQRVESGQASETDFASATAQLSRVMSQSQLVTTSEGDLYVETSTMVQAIDGLCPLWPFC